jgi:hypothetical protein
MNYAEEKFPEDINELIQKCEYIITKIQLEFSKLECLIVKDLYLANKGHRQKDFKQKLQVNCNTKLNKETKNNNEVKGLYVLVK